MKKKVEVVTKLKHWCNFCGKSEDDVAHIIAGPGDNDICNECVTFCQEIISNTKSKETEEEPNP